MGFLSPALLAGAAFVAVPVILHLVMRRQAREVVFPALRFVEQRRESNRRRLQLRHWVLLALRCALVAGLAFALARPALKGAGLRGKEGAPLAVAMVVDNSLRMQYVRQNRSRLEEASEAAAALVKKLPDDTQAAVFDVGRSGSGFAPDLSAAEARLQNLRPTASARPLAEVVTEAIAMVAEQEDRRQEVFVFTDLAEAAWTEEHLAAVNEALEEAPDVRLYIVDAGVSNPRNATLGELSSIRSVLRPGEPLRVDARVTSNLPGDTALVELYVEDEERKLTKRAERLVELDGDGVGEASFSLADLPLGTHQGEIRLAAADPLAVDNIRYFTVEVRPPAKILLVGEGAADTRFMSEALSPARFERQSLTMAQAVDAPLDDVQAVLLLDPGEAPPEFWNTLAEYAASGGGVGVFLGHNASLEAMNGEAPARVLPGKLKRISREETYFRPRRLDHPSLAGLRRYAEEIPWPACKVYRFWQFEEGFDAYVAATYANGEPAVLERSAGRGRILASTTPFSDPPEPEGRETWNLLPAMPWPFVALCDQFVGYLTQDAEGQLNYLAGETARLRLAADEQVSSLVLRPPSGEATSRMTAGTGELAIGVTDELGNYRLTAGGRRGRLDRGFSVNAAAEASELERIAPDVLAAALPEQRVRLAENLDAVQQYVSIGRSGRELYPWLISMVALVWGAEHVLANRFYRQPTAKSE